MSSINMLLLELGIPANVKGFKYIKYAVEYVGEHPDALIVSDVYVAAAKQFNTTPSCVERAIRYAISLATNFDKLDEVCGTFRTTTYKISNSQFIHGVLNYKEVQE